MKSFFEHLWDTKWALTVTAGILLGLSYPPVPLPFLIFPAFLLIFRIVDLADSARSAAYWTYPAFLIWNIIATYWLTMATVAGGVAAIVANSAVMCLPIMLQYQIQQKDIQPWLIALFQTAFWLSFEFLHHQWDLAWPWLTLANAWSNAPELVQYISVTGFWGISFWIMFSIALGYQVIKKSDMISRIVGISVFILFPVWSATIALFEKPTKADKIQQTVVVQPNFNSYYPNGGFETQSEAHDHLLQLTDSVRTDKTELVVWPENAIQSRIANINSYSEASTNTKKLLAEQSQQWNASIITGTTYYEFYEDTPKPRLLYEHSQGQFLPFNAALGFYPDSTMDVYRKHNLVPIVERVPFVHFLHDIDIFGWVNWAHSQGYGKGHNLDPFTIKGEKTPALICYDSVFPSWTRKYVKNGAGFLTIITNDGWWGNTSGHEQHFAYARLRAIELDRWIVRSANNGISGIIAPDGSIKVETPYWQKTAFRYDVPILTSKTLYTLLGDWLPAVMLILSALGIGNILFWHTTKQSVRSN